MAPPGWSYRQRMGTELLDGTPHPALDGVVLRYTGFAQRTGAPVRFRELPCTFVPLILDLGEGWEVGDGRVSDAPLEHLGAFVAGLTDGPVVVEHPGRARCLQVDLTPLGARRLLGVPMHELANRSVPLDAVLGRPAEDLIGRLADAPDWDARFAIVDRVLAARLDASPPSGARDRLGARARGGLRRARADRRPGAGAGLEPPAADRRASATRWAWPPKRVARIVRFERTLAAIASEPGAELARVAAACGFADQAHLAREVGELAALTPTQLRDEAVNSVQDPVAAPA